MQRTRSRLTALLDAARRDETLENTPVAETAQEYYMSSATISPLQQRIVECIHRDGALTFADYMRMALYDPKYGYYVTGSAKMGWEGDYYTSSDVSPLFAHCLGRQLLQMWEQLGHPSPFTVLEQGAGRGDLARQVNSWATRNAPEFATALDYRAADIATGQDALRSTNQPPSPVPTRSAIPEPQSDNRQSSPAAEQLAPRVIISNELVDAFPVHIVEKRGNQLYEVYVTADGDRLYEALGAPSSAEVTDYLSTQEIPWSTFEDGWRAEVNLDALRWMEETTRLLYGSAPRGKRRGFLLTIDYGDMARHLYTRERPDGTLTCYFRHQLNDQPLLQPGQQDITAHVNFSALLREGRRLGLRLHTFTTQSQWLADLGIYEELENVRQRDFAILDSARASDAGQIAMLRWYNLRQRVMALTDRGGMGKFKVLIMKR